MSAGFISKLTNSKNPLVRLCVPDFYSKDMVTINYYKGQWTQTSLRNIPVNSNKYLREKIFHEDHWKIVENSVESTANLNSNGNNILEVQRNFVYSYRQTLISLDIAVSDKMPPPIFIIQSRPGNLKSLGASNIPASVWELTSSIHTQEKDKPVCAACMSWGPAICQALLYILCHVTFIIDSRCECENPCYTDDKTANQIKFHA